MFRLHVNSFENKKKMSFKFDCSKEKMSFKIDCSKEKISFKFECSVFFCLDI